MSEHIERLNQREGVKDEERNAKRRTESELRIKRSRKKKVNA